MAWLDRQAIPVWNATSNHTTYDEMSEAVFREVLGHPRNGPRGQEGLSYWVRRGELLFFFFPYAGASPCRGGHVATAGWRDAVVLPPPARPPLRIRPHTPATPPR